MLNRAVGEKRKPRPKSWVEQTLLLKLLPGYLVDMTLSGLNIGRLDQEIFFLRWEWEYRMTGLDVMVLCCRREVTNNGRQRIVPLNSVAKSIK